MATAYETVSKFDRMVGGLQGGNNIPAKPTTIQHVQPITGETETFTVQTIRAEYKITVQKGWDTATETRVGDFVILTVLDKDGPVRVVLPPKVVETQQRQSELLKKKDDARRKKQRSDQMRQIMKDRMANGFVPNFKKKDA